jgi:hypothetical protein
MQIIQMNNSETRPRISFPFKAILTFAFVHQIRFLKVNSEYSLQHTCQDRAWQ